MKIKQSTIQKKLDFLNDVKQRILIHEKFSPYNLERQYHLHTTTFSSAVKLGYFTKTFNGDGCGYKCNIDDFQPIHARRLTLASYTIANKNNYTTTKSEVISSRAITRKLNVITSLTDKELISEIKRRGYKGALTLNIKKEITL